MMLKEEQHEPAHQAYQADRIDPDDQRGDRDEDEGYRQLQRHLEA
ncbi:hypothetical protein [Caulobacter zeae]|nr:hypothetical protein [Caulobacter zeae]